MRAGLARLTGSDYAPLPTVYDGLFPDGTLLTAPRRPAAPPPQRDTSAERPPDTSA